MLLLDTQNSLLLDLVVTIYHGRMYLKDFSISHFADEYLLQLSKFRDSVVGILKLSPIFGSIIEELEKYAILICFKFSFFRNSSNASLVSPARSLSGIACIPMPLAS